MSHYRGPKAKIVRRLGHLPALTSNKNHRENRPGEQGAKPKKVTPYGIRLQEKQKLRYYYGLTEAKLQKYVRRSKRKCVGAHMSTGEYLLRSLQTRLDTVVYTVGFAPSIPAARQMVSHKRIAVNGHTINIPSYECVHNDQIYCGGSVQTLQVHPEPEIPIKHLLILEYYSKLHGK
jgi:small subunit ribosomal protein S4